MEEPSLKKDETSANGEFIVKKKLRGAHSDITMQMSSAGRCLGEEASLAEGKLAVR